MDLTIEAAVCEVVEELGRAEAKFAPFNSAHEGLAVLGEEVFELALAVFLKASPEREAKMREEVVQVGAMALRFLRDVCRRDRQIAASLPKAEVGSVELGEVRDRNRRVIAEILRSLVYRCGEIHDHTLAKVWSDLADALHHAGCIEETPPEQVTLHTRRVAEVVRDLVLVGYEQERAGVRRLRDAVERLRKVWIVERHSRNHVAREPVGHGADCQVRGWIWDPNSDHDSRADRLLVSQYVPLADVLAALADEPEPAAARSCETCGGSGRVAVNIPGGSSCGMGMCGECGGTGEPAAEPEPAPGSACCDVLAEVDRILLEEWKERTGQSAYIIARMRERIRQHFSEKK